VRLRALAPGKVNLCLCLGESRLDGRHELVTLFESVSLADELLVTTTAAGDRDQVICPGVRGPNLVSGALHGLRAGGWRAPAVRVEIRKRVPVAAGMGGGSADAAAMLRLAPRLAPVPASVLAELARRLGADVPSQLEPGVALGTGAGEVVQPCSPLAPHAFLILPQPVSLSTAEVYREADRLGLPRAADELSACHLELVRALGPEGVGARPGGELPLGGGRLGGGRLGGGRLGGGRLGGGRLSGELPLGGGRLSGELPLGGAGAELPLRLLVNDLEPAAISLCPQIGEAREAALAAGAEHAIVCGSGPTVAGLYRGADSLDRATVAARALGGRFPGCTAAVPARGDAVASLE
jgi:4-diphosphocytidyl-2-C-methyl-D-erythritol kinase